MQPTTTPTPRFAPTGEAGQTAVQDSATVSDMTSPATTSDHPTTTRPVVGSTSRPAVVIHRRKPWAARVTNAYAYTILAAPLAVAGWFQSHAAHARLDLPWFWAVGFTLAWEGAAGYTAHLYLRALLRGDSTLRLRLQMLWYAACSCGLLWWHLSHPTTATQTWHLAAAVGILTVSGITLWTSHARDRRRDDLHARGLVDAQVVKFGFASWVAAPLETPAAFRYAIKHRISHPVEAIESYRADRDRRRMAKAIREARLARRLTRPVDPTTPTRPAPAKQVVDHPTTTGFDHPTGRPRRQRRKPTTQTRPVAKKVAKAKPTAEPTGARPDHPTAVPVGSALTATVYGSTALRDAATIRALYGNDPTVVGFPGRNELLRTHGGNAGRWSAALKAHADGADQMSATRVNGSTPAGVSS